MLGIGEARSEVATFLSDHLAIVTAIVTAGFVVLRVMAVARYDPEVTLALLSRSDPSVLVLGTLATMLPIWIPLALLLLDTHRVVRRNAGLGSSFAVTVGFLGLATALVVMTPIASVIASALGIGAGWLVIQVMRRRGPPSDPVSRLRSLAIALLYINVLQVVTLTQPWLPRETVGTTSGTTMVGYVLGSESGWTSVLVEPEHSVRLIADHDIVTRSPCASIRSFGLLSLPLLALVRDLSGVRPANPGCSP
jgi:hypothetical protein